MEGERILVVEDEQIVALDIRLHLEQFGYAVVGSYAAAEEALEYLADNIGALPDLIIMDIHLQGEMDGVAASNIIREQYGLPIIFMTAYADEETLARAKISEPFAYIIKPFEERELRTAVLLAMYRHKMGLALREREQLLSAVMEAMESGIIVSDSEARVRFANSRAEYISGRALSEDVAVSSVLPEPVIQDLSSAVGDISTRCTRWERTGRDARAETIEVHTHVLPGKSDGIVWVLTDISARLERERALHEQEEQLAYSRRMEAVGRMSAGLAHDFNNLVTVILGYGRLALDDAKKFPELTELKDNVQGLYDTALRSAELTRRLLTVSRVSVVSPEPFKFAEMVAEMMTMIQSVLPENVQVQFANHADSSLVYADRHNMQQVLLNLVINARDAMPDGGIVYVTSETVRIETPLATHNRTLDPGTYVLLSVADTGEGIAPENLPLVFEPFFTTKDETKGSGFGLASVYSVVADANGAIQVSSTLGHGSRFSAYLPVTGAQTTEEDLPQVIATDLHGSGTVLIVEEENGVRSMLVDTLRASGFNPVSARSVGEGVLLLDHFTDCRAVVTDLSAPYHTTSEIVQIFRRALSAGRIILLLAGEEIDAGQDGTLLKPFEPKEVLQMLQTIL